MAFVPLYIRFLGIESDGAIGIITILQGLLSLLDLVIALTISRETARFQLGIEDKMYLRNLPKNVEMIAMALSRG